MQAPVSVIIPCFKCAETIERAVDSIAKQTLIPQEVILVNDASPDHTIDILKKLQNIYGKIYGKEWIKIIDLKKNVGPGQARNLGWESASQDYLAFLDADDAWHPQKISIQYEWLQKNTQVTLIGSIPPPVTPFSADYQSLDLNYKINLVSKAKILRCNVFETSSVVVRKNISYRFDPKKWYCEDHLLWTEICLDDHLCYLFTMPLTYIFKSFGSDGLTKSLWQMREGYISNCWQLWKNGRIDILTLGGLTSYSLLKFLALLVLSPKFFSKVKTQTLMQAE
jgi:glycosyltransferase involved in cell wall biosynthesis